jgi:hypothetical protein
VAGLGSCGLEGEHAGPPRVAREVRYARQPRREERGGTETRRAGAADQQLGPARYWLLAIGYCWLPAPGLTPSALVGAQCGSNPTQLPVIMPGAQCGLNPPSQNLRRGSGQSFYRKTTKS